MLDGYKEMLQSKGTLVGRVLLSLLFITSGVNMFLGGIGNTAMWLESMGIPMATIVAILVIALKLVAGLGLLLGVKAEESALALFVFTALTILIAHLDTADMMMWKNLSIMGGLLYVMAYGPGEGWRLGLGSSSQVPAAPAGTDGGNNSY